MTDVDRSARPAQTPDFAGRRVLVTGAAWTGQHSGIGRATALAFAACGARLVLVDKNEEGLARTAAEVRDIGGVCETVTCDLTKRNAIEDALGPTCSEGVDVLASIAGFTSFRPFVSMTEEEIRSEIDLNLLSHVWLTQLALPSMLARGRGAIVLVGSDSARYGTPGLSLYCAAKGGVMSLTRSLAAEVGEAGVRVNCVSPGRTDSAARRINAASLQEGEFTVLPVIGRIGQPPEVASAIVYLASDLATYITGQILSVNGGLHRF